MRLNWVVLTLMVLLFTLLAVLSTSEVAIAAGSDSVGKLFTPQEWQSIQAASPQEIAGRLEVELNAHRDAIGEAALHLVQTNNNVKFRRTDAVFVAPRDGGGYQYAFIIHWFRDVFAGFGKDLVTKISWEIVDGQHLRARVVEDNSFFPPTHPEELNSMFKNLLPEAV